MVQFSALSLGFPRLVEVKNFDLASIHYDLRLGDFIVTVLWEYKSKALAQFYDFDQKHFFFNYEHLSRNYDRFCIERDGRSIKCGWRAPKWWLNGDWLTCYEYLIDPRGVWHPTCYRSQGNPPEFNPQSIEYRFMFIEGPSWLLIKPWHRMIPSPFAISSGNEKRENTDPVKVIPDDFAYSDLGTSVKTLRGDETEEKTATIKKEWSEL